MQQRPSYRRATEEQAVSFSFFVSPLLRRFVVAALWEMQAGCQLGTA
jgi:hypothetical protein